MLTWTPGDYAAAHNVYFGTDAETISNSTTPQKKNLPADTNEFTPGPLKEGKTYYWRVEEVNEAKTWKGKLWKLVASVEGLGRGNRILLERGLQIQGLHFINNTGQFNLKNFKASKLTTVNIWQQSPAVLKKVAPPPGLPWGQLLVNFTLPQEETKPYLQNLVSIQFGDEQKFGLTERGEKMIQNAAAQLQLFRKYYPNVLSFTNQRMAAPSNEVMRQYMRQAKPDMLMLGIYECRYQKTNPPWNDMYQRLQKHRLLALEGNDGTAKTPLPTAYFQQTFERHKIWRVPSDSEYRLCQFAPWAFGYKFIGCFVYTNVGLPVPSIHSIFFDGVGDSNPRPQFYQYAETNRQSVNLGPALVRLVTSDVRMIPNQHPLPENVKEWTPDADPYITGIEATNQTNYNDGKPGDVIVGYYKVLHESFDGPQHKNQLYFMVVNGLSAHDANIQQTKQNIRMTFDFAETGIKSLQRLNRKTAKVETVPLEHIKNSQYHLELDLPGGTGELFKFNTGAPFLND